MQEDSSNVFRKNKPHVLIIPSWFDMDFTGVSAQMFHRFAEDLLQYTHYQSGLIYGAFTLTERSSKLITNEIVRYQFLGKKKWTLPKVGILRKHWLYHYRNLFKSYRVFYGSPDLIHAQSILGLLAAEYISGRYDIPFVYTEHLSSVISGNIANRLLRNAKKTAPKASFISAVSPDLKKSMEGHFGTQVECIPNYIDCDFFSLPANRHTDPDFISIGSPAHIKGMDRLIDAFANVRSRIPGASLTLVDDIAGADELKKQINRLNLNESVHFTGPVGRMGIKNLLQKSAVLVSASREESFGLTMAEALSCGVPVVATETAGSKCIVDPECGKIVPQDSTEDLSEAMMDVFHNPDHYPPNVLRESVKKRFDKKAILRHWESVYDSVLSQESRRKR